MKEHAAAEHRTLNRWLVETLTRETLAQVAGGQREHAARTVETAAAAMRAEASEREQRLEAVVGNIAERLRQLAGEPEPQAERTLDEIRRQIQAGNDAQRKPATDWRKIVAEGNARFGLPAP